jgi:hypothetical protein
MQAAMSGTSLPAWGGAACRRAWQPSSPAVTIVVSTLSYKGHSAFYVLCLWLNNQQNFLVKDVPFQPQC